MLIHYLNEVTCFSFGIIQLTVFLSLMINGTLDLKLFSHQENNHSFKGWHLVIDNAGDQAEKVTNNRTITT